MPAMPWRWLLDNLGLDHWVAVPDEHGFLEDMPKCKRHRVGLELQDSDRYEFAPVTPPVSRFDVQSVRLMIELDMLFGEQANKS